MSFKVKMACAATLLALGSAAHAERVIVSYDSNGQGLKKGHQVKVEGNGWFAVELDENGKSAIRGQKGFKSMETDYQRFPMAIYNDDAGDPSAQQLTPYAVYQSQADQLVLQSGQKVCVIDSGIAGGQGETGGKNNDFNWSVITGDSDSGTGDWFTDGGPHGTHVAGTVGAADNGIGVVGMAPGVPMHIIKVFNASGWGYSSDLAFAAEKCTQAGANIITMSLGGGGANSTEENAFNTFTNNGGLVLAAAGNDGNNVRSYPAGYKSVMMIGANDANNNIASFSQFPTNTKTSGRGKQATTETHDGYGVEITAGGVDTLSTYPAGGATIASLTVDGVGVPTAATDNTGSVSGSTYFMGTGEAVDSGANGKICVIDRGNISFADKINNCGTSGGIGAVVINNVAGEGVIYMDITGVTTSIPAVGTAFEDRAAIVGASNASISSGASDYGYMSGTSMATPAAAGVAALVWSNHPTCTGTEIREALKATAEDQGAAGRDDYFGYGIVKAKAASDYITANGCQGGDTTDPTDPTDPPAGDLTASGSRSKGGGQLDLVWSGFSNSNVDITLTSGGATVLQDTQVNDGAVSYSGASKQATYTVTICESGTTTCAASFDL
ncbi:S8 family serine peptidase [Kangiella koreensis]|uniref:Peptidase S8 and S53 subtilisin kexin sedolisin n=1 Tax=Kangiella koreensis (strain DSM 16069 / JCM 12317 / KCTC 12182 / SW-125) TaxID=523791 RepID=C7R6U0_KANKD|nr:S8 family serine peptidase [Kangiella koreensis]ACV25606.1 peptidase S8 and S53 subtilisin kexin sedolisin [Kangiella koreensis DSM 16069]